VLILSLLTRSKGSTSFPSRTNFLFQLNEDNVIQRYELDEEEDEEKKSHNPIIEIIPANILTFNTPDKDWLDIPAEAHKDVKFRLIVSHMPILPNSNSAFAKDVISHLKPSVIFSAHDHKGLDYWRAEKFLNVTIFTQNVSDDDNEEEIVDHYCQSASK